MAKSIDIDTRCARPQNSETMGGKPMRVQVKTWGDSALVRIPSAVMTAAALPIDREVEIRAEGGRIVIEPVVALPNDLDELLDRLAPDTFHENVDFGPATGRELW